MARKPPHEALAEIQKVIEGAPAGLGIAEIENRLAQPVNRRTLQDRLASLVASGRVTKVGTGRWTKYQVVKQLDQLLARAQAEENARRQRASIKLSRRGQDIQQLVQRPIQQRKPVGYNRDFIDRYVPNDTHYLSKRERDELAKIGRTDLPNEPAGTYAKQILQRLLIDLSFNSSRLEGNTYSLLDTERLLEIGDAAEGKAQKETQMILNHKDAIDFLVEDAAEIGFDKQTILNVHGLLSNNLLPDPKAMGRLRWRSVQIGGSSYVPIGTPQLLEEVFQQVLEKAVAIADPFEQSFFGLVHLPYLQPFEDVNKRVSRLAANIPMIKNNLRPLSFIDLPTELYISAMLGVYELNRVDLLRDIYLWSYRRSAENYAAVRQSLGDPDPFRLAYRVQLRDAVAGIIRANLDVESAQRFSRQIAHGSIPEKDQEQFVRVVETELNSLHDGNFARFRVRPSEFRRWRGTWEKRP